MGKNKEAGKGSSRRSKDSRFCSREHTDSNYEKIFGKKDFREFQKDTTKEKDECWFIKETLLIQNLHYFLLEDGENNGKR